MACSFTSITPAVEASGGRGSQSCSARRVRHKSPQRELGDVTWRTTWRKPGSSGGVCPGRHGERGGVPTRSPRARAPGLVCAPRRTSGGAKSSAGWDLPRGGRMCPWRAGRVSFQSLFITSSRGPILCRLPICSPRPKPVICLPGCFVPAATTSREISRFVNMACRSISTVGMQRHGSVLSFFRARMMTTMTSR